MKTFALVYRFADSQASQDFKDSVLKTFREVREQDTDLFHYIGFADGGEPEVEDRLSGIIRNIGYSSPPGDSDYVAVYFSPEHDEDEITRQMALGKDEYIENDVTPNYRPRHISIITDLLDYDPVKHRSL